MQSFIVIIRVLIFAFSLACLTLDAQVISLLSKLDLYGSLASPYAKSKPQEPQGVKEIKAIYGFFVFNSFMSILANGYYLVTFEKRWTIAPMIWDYVVCGVGGLLWMIYTILLFSNNTLKLLGLLSGGTQATQAYGILTLILYAICGLLLYQWTQTLKQSGNNILPLSRNGAETSNIMNNSGVNSGVRMNNTTLNGRY